MKTQGRIKRHKRITKKLKGTAQRPRLVVFRSHKHFYAQLIDDTAQKTIVNSSTLNKEFLARKKESKQKAPIKNSNIAGAKEVGYLLGQKAQKLGIKQIAFDRGGYKYHGRVKALADGAREGGLLF